MSENNPTKAGKKSNERMYCKRKANIKVDYSSLLQEKLKII